MSMMTAKKSQGVAAAVGLAFRSAAVTLKPAIEDPWLALAVPAGVQNGDILVMVLTFDAATSTATAPSGWSHVPGSPLVSFGGADSKTTVLIRVAASEPASYDVDLSATVRGLAAMLAYSGGNGVTPLAGAASLAFASTTTPTAPSVTPAVNNCMVLAIYGCDQSSVQSWTPPAGYTERIDAQEATSLVTVHVAEKAQTTAGAEAPQATISGADEGVAFTLALRPA